MPRAGPFRLVYIPGKPGFAPWVRKLKGKNGVYLIRSDRGKKRLLYVGESHSGRLYETFTRHFQKWRGFGHGVSYNRSAVKAGAIVYRSGRQAVTVQKALIARLNPRDNDKGLRSQFD